MSTFADASRVRCLDAQAEFSRERVYFAFENGRLTYDCASCGAHCCRGFGYRLNVGAELNRQLTARPTVALFLNRDSKARLGYNVSNCVPQCFFLTESKMCSVHLEHGYDAKPETCRLFPFNYMRIAGDWLIVAPHRKLCPLRIVPPERQSESSAHDMLFQEMTRGHIGAHVARVGTALRDIGLLIAIEGQIRDHGSVVSGQANYVESVLHQIAAIAGGHREHRSEASVQESTIRGVMRMMTDTLGVAPLDAATCDPHVVETMVACTPVVRSELVFGAGDADDARPVLEIERTPYFLLGLYVLVSLARQAGMPHITYQTILGILYSEQPLLWLLAHVDRVMMCDPDKRIEWPIHIPPECRPAYLRVIRDLLPSRQLRHGRTLASILCEHVPAGDLVTRVELLKYLAPRLSGRLVEAGEERRGSGALMRVRLAAQRWALGNVSEAALLAAQAPTKAHHGAGAA